MAVGGPGGKPAASPTPLMQSQGEEGPPKAPDSLFRETSKELTAKPAFAPLRDQLPPSLPEKWK